MEENKNLEELVEEKEDSSVDEVQDAEIEETSEAVEEHEESDEDKWKNVYKEINELYAKYDSLKNMVSNLVEAGSIVHDNDEAISPEVESDVLTADEVAEADRLYYEKVANMI